MKFLHLVRLLRPEQYYKNLVMLLALYFSGNFLNLGMAVTSAVGFVLLCLASSANYVLNDIVDREKDRHNREKADRPLASGKLSAGVAMAVLAALLVVSLGGAYYLEKDFFALVLLMLLSGTLYTLLLKKELFADVIAIALNYVFRAVAGAKLIGVWVSPWLVVGVFFLALFLAVGKRSSEKAFLGQHASRHRPLLGKYTEKSLDVLLQISAVMLLTSYAIYVVLGQNPELVITIPLALYIVLRYVNFVEMGAPASRKISRIFADSGIALAAALFSLATFAILYR